jgi:hypothetical protein
MQLLKPILLALLFSMLAGPMSVLAHHSHASLDMNDVRTKTGVVTKYFWRAPHVYISAEALNEKGELVNYMMEMGSLPAMKGAGWDKDTWKTGDRITWQGPHDRNPERPYMGLRWAENANGDRLFASSRDKKKYLEEKGIKEEKAEARIEPALAIGSGTWFRSGPNGTRFKNVYSPEKAMSWPLTAKTRTRAENFDESENPINECLYTGPPRAIVSLLNFNWSRPDDKTIIIDRDLWSYARVIHLDKDHPRGEPSNFGHSIGWFEGDELIVETDNFVAEVWGMYTGIDSSAQKQLRERYYLSNNGMQLNVEFTITDPVHLTEPTTVTHQWKKVADAELIKAPCSMEQAKFYITAGYDE